MSLLTAHVRLWLGLTILMSLCFLTAATVSEATTRSDQSRQRDGADVIYRDRAVILGEGFKYFAVDHFNMVLKGNPSVALVCGTEAFEKVEGTLENAEYAAAVASVLGLSVARVREILPPKILARAFSWTKKLWGKALATAAVKWAGGKIGELFGDRLFQSSSACKFFKEHWDAALSYVKANWLYTERKAKVLRGYWTQTLTKVDHGAARDSCRIDERISISFGKEDVRRLLDHLYVEVPGRCPTRGLQKLPPVDDGPSDPSPGGGDAPDGDGDGVPDSADVCPTVPGDAANGCPSEGLGDGSTWHIKDSLGGGNADLAFTYGHIAAGDIPVVGDWNGDGIDTPGVVNGATWFLSDTLNGGSAERQFTFGQAGDVFLVGDWNGDGVDTAGVFRGGWWYLTNSAAEASTDVAFYYGDPTDFPLAGDWDANGTDSPGVYRSGTWYLRNALSGGPGDVGFTYGGNPGVRPLVGDWNHDGYDTAGIVDNNVWYLENGNDGGNADYTPFAYGQVGWRFLSGDFNGDGTDTTLAIEP